MDKIPQNAVELEKVILGAILIDYKAIYSVPFLQASHFYEPVNRMIFESCLNVAKKSQIDIQTVIEDLKKSGNLNAVGGYIVIANLTDRVITSSRLEEHCRIVMEKWMLRELSNLGRKMESMGNNDQTDCFDLIDLSYNSITKIHNGIKHSATQTIPEIFDEFDKKLENINKGKTMGIKSFSGSVTDYTSGWRGGKVYIIAARPGMGKSAYMVNEINQQLTDGKSVVCHNLEMTNEELVVRIIALRINESPSEISKGKINNISAYQKAKEEIINSKLFIFTQTNLSDIILNTKMIQATHGVDCIFVDYLQFARVKGLGRREEVGEISRTLKEIAKDMDVPVIALAQLSRTVEDVTNKIPQLSHLKESGDIEQDADCVMFIWRPEYYKIQTFDFGWGVESTTDKGVLIFAKNRGDKTGDILIKWSGHLNKFY